ncbi:MAG TPA: AraC family transcriptional regulator [Chryseolinea sp.]|nr:AraC family transcriptional regulator [Chryseolinea sp.]HPM31812.1 AraC family transcriptional regulator [Chryseolinea sp.]
MNQFFLHHKQSKELEDFPHILEFAVRKNTSIQLNSLGATTSESIRIYYVLEGKFEWVINDHQHILYPGDLAMILPGKTFQGKKDFLDIGTLFWIQIQLEKTEDNKRMVLGNWSGLSGRESAAIWRVLQLNSAPVLVKLTEALNILQSIQNELHQQQIGYTTRVNHLITELLILIARQSTHQNNLRRDFPQTFMKLEQALRQNLSHQWTVEEMAGMVGLGSTAFTEKVKNYTGFSPLNYLINIRISEAIKLLRKEEENVTSIALETGFYSSQHFSTTFKKLTGYTPGEFRKRNSSKK